MTGKLFIVATPIGNMEDITFRAIETLKEVDFVLCEDTRVTKNLLGRYDIETPTISYHQHSDEKKVKEIEELLNQGKDLALVTDAGTPGISDPGNRLVQVIARNESSSDEAISQRSNTNEKCEIASSSSIPRNEIIPIPGASAVITALSISGFPTDKFIFMGFPPHKKGRNKFFKEVGESKHTAVFYESCHRIIKCLEQLKEVLGDERQVCVCRELTKKFETIYRGTIEEVINQNIPPKGEFVVVVSR